MAEKKIPLDLKKIGKAKPKPKTKQKRKGSFFRRMKPVLKKVLLGMAALFVVCFVVMTAIIVSYIRDAPPFDPEALFTVETSYVYDRDGNEVTELHDEQNRVHMDLIEIPLLVQQAFLAIEDERFYKHSGFDMIGFTRALWVNIRTRGFTQGASTISQQLAQNAFLGQEKRIKRKVQEIWLSLQLERRYSKPEILEMYLNRIYFGEGAYGVEAAAQTYFDKSIVDVSIAEAAMLAGIVRSPNYYNPLNNEEQAINRMKLVLYNMQRLGYITESEYAAAVSTEFAYGEPLSHEYPYPYFIDYVVHKELIKILTDLSEIETVAEAVAEAYKTIYTGGLRIYTTLDPVMQQHVEDTLNRNELYPQTLYIDMPKLVEAIAANNYELPRDYPDAYIDEENGIPQPQSALVLSDPRTGEIHALGGGRDYSKKRNEGLRYLSERQAGSAIKPVITYAAALEEGILGVGSALDDSPIAFPAGPEPWYPENYDSKFRGMVTVRNALAYSYNIPAVRAYQMVGAQKGAQYARDMGISTFDPLRATLSWALGAREVTAMDMAEAFGVFANNGIRMELYTVQRIEDRRGRVIYEKKADPRQVLSEQATFMMNSILQDVLGTTAAGLQATRPMAAKTGTTDEYRDVYLVAYTPNVVASFWMGYDQRIMGRITRGWSYTTGVVREVFNEMFKTLPVEQFPPRPPGVVSVEVCTKSGLLPSDQCREAESVRADFFLADHVPRLHCDMHITLEICTASNLLACEFCPEDSVTTMAFFNRPEFITTDHNWTRGAGREPEDAAERAPTEKCDVHTERVGEITSFEYESPRHNLVVLTWEFDPGENGGEADSFHLSRIPAFPEEEPLKVQDGDVRSYEDHSVTYDTKYTYTIYAVNHQGVRSEPVSVTVDSTEEPKKPKKPSLDLEETNESEVTLTWTQNDPEDVDYFQIFRQDGPDGPFTQISEDLPCETGKEDPYYFTDQVPGPGDYTYYVRAKNPAEHADSAHESITINGNGENGNGENGNGENGNGENGNGENGNGSSTREGLFGLWGLISRTLAGLMMILICNTGF